MFRLSNHNTLVSVLRRDWESKSAALPSWKVLDWHLSPRLEQQLWHPGSLVQGTCVLQQQRSRHCALCKCADRWAPLQGFPPSHSVSHWLREGERGAEERTGPPNISWVKKGTVSCSLCSRRALVCTQALEPLKKNGECAELSPAVQARTRLRWSLLSYFRARFWQLLYEKLSPQPQEVQEEQVPLQCRGFCFVSSDILLLSHFLHWGFWTLLMNPGLNNWLFYALTLSGVAWSMDGLVLQLKSKGTSPACRFLV